MPLRLLRGDLLQMDADAIVNATNPALQMGGGVCGAIFTAAGAADMRAACDAIGGCETGEAVITLGFRLRARHVIHTVGPVWQGGEAGEETLLTACYRNALTLAQARGLRSVAFPLISAGAYGYPPAQARAVAVHAIGAYLRTHEEMEVALVLRDDQPAALAGGLQGALRDYLAGRLTLAPGEAFAALPFAQPPEGFADGASNARAEGESFSNTGAADVPPPCGAPAPSADVRLQAKMLQRLANAPRKPASTDADTLSRAARERTLRDAVAHLGDTFSEAVLHWIDRKGQRDVDIYKRANLDRKLFSKLRSDRDYRPSKQTAVALCVGLELNLDETCDLLSRAGYALSTGNKADLIVAYFIEHGMYDIYALNEALFVFEQPCLGE